MKERTPYYLLLMGFCQICALCDRKFFFLISFAVFGTIFARKPGLKIYSWFFQPEMFYISNERTNCAPLVMCQSDFKIFLSCTLNYAVLRKFLGHFLKSALILLARSSDGNFVAMLVRPTYLWPFSPLGAKNRTLIDQFRAKIDVIKVRHICAELWSAGHVSNSRRACPPRNGIKWHSTWICATKFCIVWL